MVISKRGRDIEEIRKGIIAVPGLKTSAYLGLRMAWGDVSIKVIAFDEIIDAVLSEEVDGGLPEIKPAPAGLGDVDLLWFCVVTHFAPPKPRMFPCSTAIRRVNRIVAGFVKNQHTTRSHSVVRPRYSANPFTEPTLSQNKIDDAKMETRSAETIVRHVDAKLRGPEFLGERPARTSSFRRSNNTR